MKYYDIDYDTFIEIQKTLSKYFTTIANICLIR